MEQVRQCIMQNDVNFCHSIMTVSSHDVFNRFVSYKLMPCLPTDFRYDSEQKKAGKLIVKTYLPPEGGITHSFRLVFQDDRLDIPETFHVGFGENWQNKINLSEQLFLMMRQNMQDKLTCDLLRDLAKPEK